MGSDHPVIVFDGVCNLCNGAVQFIIKRDKKAVFRFAPLQSDYGKKILDGKTFSSTVSDSILLVSDQHLYQKSEAVLRIARQLSGAWPLFYGLRIIPLFIRDALYDWVARNRYRFFGKKDQCIIPTAELKSRFYQ